MHTKLEPVMRLEDALVPFAKWDALVLVTGTVPPRLPPTLTAALRSVVEVDAAALSTPSLVVTPAAPGQRLVVSPTGPLLRDHDDVRRFADAAVAGIARAKSAGAVRPCLVVCAVPDSEHFGHALEVSLLAALGALWEPLEAREALGEEIVSPVEAVGFVVPEHVDGERVARWIAAVEAGRTVARDIAGTQPERMAPPRMADYCRDVFESTDVAVDVVDDIDRLRADYPLLFAVSRAAMAVPRHHPKVIRLSWSSPEPIERTILLAGKGVTYDTGGADLKTGGHMAGMSRDKGGAAAVAGIVAAIAALKPPGVRVIAEIGAVRNSVGADAFVSDEIIVSHAGVRVRVGNTDAEGRLVLADLLSHLRTRAISEVNPHIYSLATLTGHAVIAMGPYTAVLDNGPARAQSMAERLQAVGDLWGEPVEVSRLRREDFDFVRPRTQADDVLSANNKPSSATPRGHQFPAAFLQIASGLSRHGTDGEQPLPYTHVDIGGSAVSGLDWQHGRPTGAPVVVFSAMWTT